MIDLFLESSGYWNSIDLYRYIYIYRNYDIYLIVIVLQMKGSKAFQTTSGTNMVIPRFFFLDFLKHTLDFSAQLASFSFFFLFRM